ncbi:MAG: DMT family transporter [Bacteroidales bacterium]|nr:DMT family transporter [Bacteroidales bacterium]
MKSRTAALIAAFIANLIYGINYVVAKGIMPDYLQPRAVIFVRVIVAALLFWLITAFIATEKVSKKHLFQIAIAAFFGVATNQILFFEGLNLTTPINASIIMVGVPIAVLLFSQWIHKERITKTKILGIALGSFGAAYLILGSGEISFHQGTFIGNILILLNASAYALYLVLIKPIMKHYKALTVMRWVFLFGAIYIIPFTLPIALKANWSEIPFDIWLSITYVIVFTTFFAYLLNNFSLKTLHPSTNSAFIYLQPVFSSVVALSMRKDTLEIQEVVAALFIFAGVYFVSRKKQLDVFTTKLTQEK